MSDQVPIGRLAWLACQPELERSSRRWWDHLARLTGGNASGRITSGEVSNNAGLGVEMTKVTRSARLAPLQFAVDELVPRLTAEDRSTLRDQGVLPDWFVPAVLEHAEQIKKDLRRRR